MASRTKRVSFNARSKRGTGTDGDVQMGSASEPSASKKSRSSSNRGIGQPGGSHSTEERRKPYSPASTRRGGHHANQTAVFKKTTAAVTSTSKGAIEMLKEFLSRRYDQASSLLNLENMAGDEAFSGSKGLLAPGERSHSRSSAAPALWKLVGEQYPQTVSISLANNKLKELVDLAPAALIRALPNLQNLSLKNNLLADIKSLNPLMTDESISRTGLNCLAELVLEGNPMREVALANGTYPAFVQEIATRFPTLSALDGQALQPTKAPQPVASTSKTPLGSGLKQAASFPVGVQPGFSDDSKALVAAFLIKYFTLFDSNRALLYAAYSPQATFSVSVNSAIPFRAKASKAVQDLPRQHKLNWQPYFDQSRNMLKTHKIDEAQLQENIKTRLYTSPADIVNAFSKLPATKHPLTEANKFVVDGWTQMGIAGEGSTCLFVSLHGQFLEEPSGGSRAFDRSFILAPPQAGDANTEWPCLILSDQLVVRGFSEPKAWADNALRVAAPPEPQPSTSQIPVQANGSSSLTPEQQQLVLECQTATRLNVHYAQQCLMESGWDLQKAIQNFQLVASQVPPEAFV